MSITPKKIAGTVLAGLGITLGAAGLSSAATSQVTPPPATQPAPSPAPAPANPGVQDPPTEAPEAPGVEAPDSTEAPGVEAPDSTEANEPPGGHEDPPGQNVDHQFEGIE